MLGTHKEKELKGLLWGGSGDKAKSQMAEHIKVKCQKKYF